MKTNLPKELNKSIIHVDFMIGCEDLSIVGVVNIF